MSDAIVTEGISKKYGNITALDGVTLSVPSGMLFGLIGPDGAGKTTLYKILSTLLLPDNGAATINGMDIRRDYRKIRASIGYMPERFSLYPDLTVSENLKFFASLYGVGIRDNFDLIAPVFSQLAKFPDRRAGALSGGMKQKLALSCALIHRPKVLLLDEPTTGVDAVSRNEFWAMLSTLREKGITILVSTSYMDEAQRCERIAMIERGRILEVNTPGRLAAGLGRNFYNASAREMYPLLQALRTFPEVKNCYTFGATLHVVTADGFDAASTVRRLETMGLTDVKIYPATGTVEDLFIKLGFLGANGAGKTTAIRMLCGLSRPTSGSGQVAGYDITSQPEEIKRRIGYMSQKFSLYEDLTVTENLTLFATIYGMDRKLTGPRIGEVSATLGMDGMMNTLARDIPVGWKQKLAFAATTIHRPEIVFLDEPTGGVDPLTRRKFWEIIYRASSEGMTVFVTTHYLDEAEYCNRISIMVDGHIEALDSPARLKKRYGAQTIDEVFRIVAKDARRGD